MEHVKTILTVLVTVYLVHTLGLGQYVLPQS